METWFELVALLFAVATLVGIIACWAHASRLQRMSRGEVRAMQRRIDGLHERIKEVERDLARQGVELEEQGIRLETQLYWQED